MTKRRKKKSKRQKQHWAHKRKDKDKQNTENYKDEQHRPHKNTEVNPGAKG